MAHSAMRAADARTVSQAAFVRPLHRSSILMHDVAHAPNSAPWTPVRLRLSDCGAHVTMVRMRRLGHLGYDGGGGDVAMT